MAYQWGKAAKIAPPAVSSQTSLPSQKGPIAESICRRRVCPLSPSAPSRPSTGSSIPTP